MYYVYVLKSQIKNWYYVGQTNSIEKRLKRHNAGGVSSTRHYKPFDLVYSIQFSNRQDAIREEHRLKSLKHGEAFKKLIV